MDAEIIDQLRKVGQTDQHDAVIQRVMELWDVDPYLANALTSLVFHLGRTPTEQETEVLVSWVLETLVRWRLLEGFMEGRWFIVGLSESDPQHPRFGSFKAGGTHGEGTG